MIWAIVGAVALVVMYFIGIYNGLVRARNEAKNGWSQIDVQLIVSAPPPWRGRVFP